MKKISDTVDVTINSPDEVLWQGKANSVSSENSIGLFDILPGHSNFVTLVKDKPIIIRMFDKEKTFSYKNSVIAVHGEEVKIYVDI